MSSALEFLRDGLPLDPLPKPPLEDANVPHAPPKSVPLSDEEFKLALKNALRYFPERLHTVLAHEFAQELRSTGHVYMYRFRPSVVMKAYPLQDYPSRCVEGAAIMAMIMNNLDPNVAQFPHELVTYGGNGQVFSNWAQFRLTMAYLAQLTREQTLIMYSGHPLGLFPSTPSAPRMTITNGLVIPNYSSQSQYEKMFALGVTMYGQMTAGSFCYIGPQGIVHGTTITILNAGRKYLGTDDLRGKVFLSSGLGGMSGAQAKAAVVCGCVGVIAEVSEEALVKRHRQGWLDVIISDLDSLVARVRTAKRSKETLSIGFHGNIVSVWRRMVKEYKETGELLVDLGSDQTSCHNPFSGGYYPAQLSYDEANVLLKNDVKKFEQLVAETLKLHIEAINELSAGGMHFWDYGNAFLLQAYKVGAEVGAKENAYGLSFKYPSYVQHIMGDIFSMGFGPFRWVCMSQREKDLDTTDAIAANVLEELASMPGLPQDVQGQYHDNLKWIKAAGQHKLVVGSQARILYSDQPGRVALAVAFNDAVAARTLSGPVVISRDHHDVSGTDSPFRETSNIYDGSAFCADMATQNFVGDAARGATWVALHNGGGVGWGEVINGGFGLVLDGSKEAEMKARSVLNWDVSNGVARRAWSGNMYAADTIERAMKVDSKLKVTVANKVSDSILTNI